MWTGFQTSHRPLKVRIVPRGNPRGFFATVNYYPHYYPRIDKGKTSRKREPGREHSTNSKETYNRNVTLKGILHKGKADTDEDSNDANYDQNVSYDQNISYDISIFVSD